MRAERKEWVWGVIRGKAPAVGACRVLREEGEQAVRPTVQAQLGC